MQDKDFTKVVFRKWKENGAVIALFPELPADTSGNFCDSFEHIGQHGGADYHGVLEQTYPARPHEYAELKTELETVYGYRLQIISRATWRIHHKRDQEASL